LIVPQPTRSCAALKNESQQMSSAVMSGLTPADFTTLSQLGIRTVCDFRANGERARDVVN
jgi:hypothetical protein